MTRKLESLGFHNPFFGMLLPPIIIAAMSFSSGSVVIIALRPNRVKLQTGRVIYGLPIEELMFGFSCGLVWTGIYEYFTWKRSASE